MKKVFSLLLLLLSLFIISCGDKKVLVEEIKVEANTEMAPGEKQTLKITVLPENVTDKETLVASSDESIVKVNGVEIEALKEGSCTITVKAKDDSNVKTDIAINVKNKGEKVLVKEIKTSIKTEMAPGEKQSVAITVLPENATNKETLVTSSDESIVKVNGNTLEALKEGSCTITIKAKDDSNVKTEVQIQVKNATEIILVNDLNVESKEEMKVGDKQTLVISVLPENATNKETVVISSDESVIKVNGTELEALKEGTCVITVSTKDGSNVKKEITINVKPLVDTKDAEEKLKEFVCELGNEVFENLPTSYEGYTIEYEMDKNIDKNGVVTRDEFDVESNGKIYFIKDDIKIEDELTLSILGTYVDVLVDKFLKSLPEKINGKLYISFKDDMYGGSRVLIKETSKPEYFDKSGNYNRPFHDEEVVLTLNVRTTTPKTSKTILTTVIVAGLSIEEKSDKVLEWLYESYPKNSVRYYDDPSLPEFCDDYDSTIIWTDSNGDELNFKKIAQDPVLGETQILNAKIKCRGEEINRTVEYLVWNKRYNNTQEKIEDFVNALYYNEVKVYKYKSAAYFETNWGYLPFYFPGDANINKDYMLDYTYGRVRTGIKKASTEYVVIHDTAGGSPTHTAQNFALNQVNANKNENNDYISWHFTVGEDGIYQSLPLDEVAYHAGDGSHVYGDTYFNNTYKKNCIGGGNRNGIGIESCINAGADYNVTLRKLAKLVAELLLEFDLGFDRIKQHFNFSGKDCPGVIRHYGRWEEFKNLVKIEYFGKTQLEGTQFEYKSLTPDLLDNTGKVIYKDKNAKVLKYEITAKYEDWSKTYSFTSNLLKYEDWSNVDLSK